MKIYGSVLSIAAFILFTMISLMLKDIFIMLIAAAVLLLALITLKASL